MCLHITTLYESNLLQRADQVIPHLLNYLEDWSEKYSSMEVIFQILLKLLPEFHFKHADRITTCLEKLRDDVVSQDSKLIMRMSNPILTMLLGIDILTRLKTQFNSLSLRISSVEDTTRSAIVAIYENYPYPEKIEILLKQKDIQGRTVLEHLAELKFYEFLQINQVNRIVSSMWRSKTDTGGSIFDQATCFDLTFVNQLRFKEDRELRKRFT